MTMAKRKIISLILAITMLVSLVSVMTVTGFAASGAITEVGGWFESAYVEWSPIDGADGYNVYVAAAGSSDWKPIDDMLIRSYGSYWRADAVGLKAGSYQMKVVPVKDKAETDGALTTSNITVMSHDRSGFAFVNGTSSGAYNEDGTLKAGAVVIYVTNENKDTVSLTMKTESKKTETKVGIQNILLGLKKGFFEYPICIRFIGNITDPVELDKGDLIVDINNAAFTKGITIEGIGEDTVFNGFGLRIKGATNVEVRNIAFMNCDSNEGDNVGLQQDNDHIWIHNCDFFYGDAGSDADQAKGDGALDTKVSTYITHSYNHFYDTGKSNLQGMKSESTNNSITYHHNWFDHSDSRHPRVRTCTVHVYNNLYDGIAKYGIGATSGCSIFSEANYFLNSKNPMMISLQGTDAKGDGTFSGENGGIIKSYGDVMVNSGSFIPYSQNNTSFDAYVASSRDEQVPSSVKALVGGTTYNNFDTSDGMYTYTVETAEQAANTVRAYAGRMNGGDFEWTFTDADNTSYDVIPGLKNALKAYTSSIVSIGGNGTNASTGNDSGSDNGGNQGGSDNGGNAGGNTGDNVGGDNDNTGGNQGGTTLPAGAYEHNFTTNGKDSTFFTINGNLSTSKGSVTYNNLNLTQCLKIESSTSISFTAPEKGTLILVFGGETNASGKKIKIDGESVTIDSTQILTVEVEAGTHTIKKDSGINLFFMAYYSESQEHTHSYTEVKVDPTCTENGSISYTCECGDSYNETIDALGHSFSEGICLNCSASDPYYTPDIETPDEEDKPNEETPDEEDKPNEETPDNGENEGGFDNTDEAPAEPEQPKKENFITRIFNAILSFLRKLFGFK